MKPSATPEQREEFWRTRAKALYNMVELMTPRVAETALVLLQMRAAFLATEKALGASLKDIDAGLLKQLDAAIGQAYPDLAGKTPDAKANALAALQRRVNKL